MSIVIQSHKSINDVTSAALVNTHSVSSGNAAEWAFGEVGLHWDFAYISNLDSSDPIRITFDDFNDIRIDAGDGFVIPAGASIEIKVQYSWSIHVKRHSGSNAVDYSILCSINNRLRG